MKIADILVQQGHLNEADLLRARAHHQQNGTPLLHTLIQMELVSPEQLIKSLSECYSIPVFDLRDLRAASQDALDLLPVALLQKLNVFPIKIEDGKLHLIFGSYPIDLPTLDMIKSRAGLKIQPYLAKGSDIRDAIERFIVQDKTKDALDKLLQEATVEVSLKTRSGQASPFDNRMIENAHSPVVRLVDLVVQTAVRSRASDIHFEPRETTLAIRYRIDGRLTVAKRIPPHLAASIVARLKIMSDLDISERRRPQDGRIRIGVDGKDVNLRVSTVPTVYGEKVVLRLLNHELAGIKDIRSLGFNEKDLHEFQDALDLKQGIVLITGPTGSGKTTTIYTALNQMSEKELNITTIEDPVEHCIDGLNQIQVNHKTGLTFASILRSTLRQDPDVIFVGEIRDSETADVAFKSALTGHLVFSTLHTNGCLATLARLRDMGLEPFLMASALRLVVAQRLLRLNCRSCRVPYAPNERALERMERLLSRKLTGTFYRSPGCHQCSDMGFKGRTAVYETLKISDKVRSLIAQEAPAAVILEQARQEGFSTLVEQAAAKAEAGLTTLEEIYEVLDMGLKISARAAAATVVGS